MSIEVGNVLEGIVTGITNFGAFVELPGGKVGLIHISEVADVYVKDVKDFLKEREKVKVKVLTIDGNKIGLSIKQLQEKKPLHPAAPRANTTPARFTQRKNFNTDFRRQNNLGVPSFEDKLSKFLKDSDEKLTDLRKKTDSKRGGRGSRHYE
ncbi:S1 RNA-binding domain-containing protein [Pectinatus cerevisiiphilus]|uniref:S1 RNA binding domain protein n=1 Tax=Pectinatus cerevisiiphilus TaxID=86956 RepID=A0A4V2USD3_9FIRM|nr:S1 RNA-binding domain-containing protein [Pectinatus cerevisiiphilus]TCS81002.1 S1 RNA binding domain protein [Pectinatus cerevisiiphilus]